MIDRPCIKQNHEKFKSTVIWPLGVSGGSQVTTIVDELNGRTWMLRGALSIAIIFHENNENYFHNVLIPKKLRQRCIFGIKLVFSIIV